MTFGVRQSIAYTDRSADGYTNTKRGNSPTNSVVATYMYPAYWDPTVEGDQPHQFWGSNMYDIYWLAGLQPQKTNDIVYNGTAYAQITPVKGLTLKSQLALNAFDTRSTQTVLPSFPGNNGEGQSSEGHSRSSMWTITNTAEYKFKNADIHHYT